VTSDALTTAARGEVIDLPSDAGQVTLTGTAVVDRHPGTVGLHEPVGAFSHRATPLTVSEDDQAGSIQATGVAADMSVARGDIVINSTGAGGLTVGPDGSVGTSDGQCQCRPAGAVRRQRRQRRHGEPLLRHCHLRWRPVLHPQQVATATDKNGFLRLGGGEVDAHATTTVPTTTTAPHQHDDYDAVPKQPPPPPPQSRSSASVPSCRGITRAGGASNVSLACRGASACAGMVTLDRKAGGAPPWPEAVLAA